MLKDPGDNSNEKAAYGAKVYSKPILTAYDALVIYFENSFVWKCPSCHILDFYNQNISNKHLDVGVGSGYFLDHCRFISPNPMISLLDLNCNSLQFAAKRIRRYYPTAYHANVLKPLLLGSIKFDSIGVNYLLHCLPGNLINKQVIFKHLKPFLNKSGILFGSTILGESTFGWPGKLFMNLYNSRLIPGIRVLDNRNDTVGDLEMILKEHFSQYTIKIIGHVALFAAKEPIETMMS